jgi:ABC-type branched-subunit amino acid transport system ATPase component/ABC-type branched-subunit amino acid transport system permease subunit
VNNSTLFYLTNLLIYAGVDAMACLGLSQQFGVAGVTNFGFIIFQAAGAYTAAILSLPSDQANGAFQRYVGGWHLPFPFPWMGAAVVGGLLALPFTFLVGRRLRGDFAAIGLLVTAVMLNLLVTDYRPFLNGDAGLSLVPAPLQNSANPLSVNYQLAYSAVAIIGCLLIYLFLQRVTESPYGRSLRAMRENDVVADSLGKNLLALRTEMLVLGGAIAGLSGAVLVGFINTWAPGTWTYAETIVLFAAVIIGGVGNHRGAVLGAILVPVGFEEATRFIPSSFGRPGLVPALQWVAIGLLIVAFLWFRPQGLLPEPRRIPGRYGRSGALTGSAVAGSAVAGGATAGGAVAVTGGTVTGGTVTGGTVTGGTVTGGTVTGGTVTGGTVTGGTVTGDAVTGGAVTGGTVTGGTVTGGTVTGGTVAGRTVAGRAARSRAWRRVHRAAGPGATATPPPAVAVPGVPRSPGAPDSPAVPDSMAAPDSMAVPGAPAAPDEVATAGSGFGLAPTAPTAPRTRPEDTGAIVLEASDLVRTFDGVAAVAGVSFTVQRGRLTGLIGPNGAGKSTVLAMLAGTIPVSSGTIRYRGRDITAAPAFRRARDGLVRTFQLASEFKRLTVLENLLSAVPGARGDSFRGAVLGRRYWRGDEAAAIARAQAMLDRFGLTDLAHSYAGELSGGQRRLVEIMRALMAEPEVLLLDEPMAGVHRNLARSIGNELLALCAQGLTILMVEHELAIMDEFCDPVVVMAEGRVLAEGTMASLRRRAEVVEAYLVG